MPRKQYPYQNTSLKNIRGEKWDDIPGLDGYFCLSNFGRIRRMEYETQFKNGRIVIRKEQIIKPRLMYTKNRFKKEKVPFLIGAATVEGVRHIFTIQRMVYYLFVATFDLEDHRIVILCKDTDNLNIRPSNLRKSDIHQKTQRVVQRGRMRSPLLDLNEATRNRMRRMTIERNSIQVSKYNNKGKKLATYHSMAEAEKKTGTYASSIAVAAKKKFLRAGGYFWRFGVDPFLNVDQLKKEQRRNYIENRGQKLTQYDTTGRKIATYPGVREASEASGAAVNSINKALRGELKSARGFIWKKGIGADRIDLSNYKIGRESAAAKRSRPVLQFDLKGKLVNKFNSVKAAAVSFNKQPATLSYVLKGHQKTCGGYIWKFADKKDKK